MLTSDIIVNYIGILITFTISVITYFALNFLSDKISFLKDKKVYIIILMILLILSLSYFLKGLVYVNNCIEYSTPEISYAGAKCTSSLLFP